MMKLMETSLIIILTLLKQKNLEDCQKFIFKNKLDVGLAFDGDGDRLGVVDDKGRIIPGDKVLLLLAKNILKKKKKLE